MFQPKLSEWVPMFIHHANNPDTSQTVNENNSSTEWVGCTDIPCRNTSRCVDRRRLCNFMVVSVKRRINSDIYSYLRTHAHTRVHTHTHAYTHLHPWTHETLYINKLYILWVIQVLRNAMGGWRMLDVRFRLFHGQENVRSSIICVTRGWVGWGRVKFIEKSITLHLNGPLQR